MNRSGMPPRRHPLLRGTSQLRRRRTDPGVGPASAGVADTSPLDPLWKPDRQVALERDCWACAVCQEITNVVNHRVPRQMGGRNDDPTRHAPQKLVTMCPRHHEFYETKERAQGYELGYFVRVGLVADEVPVLYAKIGAWFTLTRYGTRLWVADR